MNRNPALTFASASLLGRRRSLIIPAALAGGLLLFGGRAVHAAGVPVPARQFTIAGQTVTTSGSGFVTSMDTTGLRVVVGDGEAFVTVGNQVMDRSSGADVTISSLAYDDINSINVKVAEGNVSLRTLGSPGSDTSDDIGAPATGLQAGESLGFATGPDQALEVGDPDGNFN